MIIISRCPYRISLLGGGSDLNWFLDKHEKGACLGFSIPIFSRVVLGNRDDSLSSGILNYSSREEYSDLNSICHPIIRNCFKMLKINKPLELASFGEPFSGSGLGSSSSFTVALIKGLCVLNNLEISNFEIADLACQIEIEKMNKPIGKQDQYLCALGGINILGFEKNKSVTINNSNHIILTVKKYMENTFIVNTGISRSATKVLKEIRSHSENYEIIKEIYNLANKFLSQEKKDQNILIDQLHKAILKSWSLKKNIKGIMNDKLIEKASYLEIQNFKILKLLGAGGGGYFLVKYYGNDFDKDKNSLFEKDLILKKVSIFEKGCEYWKI